MPSRKRTDYIMARIVGVEIPNEKRVEIALTYIHGIGRSLSNKILKASNVDPDRRVKDLKDEDISKIGSVIQKTCRIEGDLRREVTANIKRLTDISSYRGVRHRKNLPVRGQRTHTNARTRKGPRKTVGIVRSKEKRKEFRTGERGRKK